MSGEAADERDRWLKEIYFPGQLQKTSPPRPKAKYYDNEFRRALKKHGQAEVSGSALSRTLDVRARAMFGLEQLASAMGGAQPHVVFRHIVHVKVANARAVGSFDVLLTPQDPEHLGHADLIAAAGFATKLTEAATEKLEHEPFRLLAEVSEICDASDLDPLDALRHT